MVGSYLLCSRVDICHSPCAHQLMQVRPALVHWAQLFIVALIECSSGNKSGKAAAAAVGNCFPCSARGAHHRRSAHVYLYLHHARRGPRASGAPKEEAGGRERAGQVHKTRGLLHRWQCSLRHARGAMPIGHRLHARWLPLRASKRARLRWQR